MRVLGAALKQNSSALDPRHFFAVISKKWLQKKTGQEDGLALEYASDELETDQQVVLATVKQNGLALKFASDELKTDQQVVLEAVKQTGLAVKFASDHLRG